MERKEPAVLRRPRRNADEDSPLPLANTVGGRPHIDFSWKRDANGKRRLIGNPNKPMRKLHELFGRYLKAGIEAMGDDNHPLIRLPSSSAFVKGTNPLKNAERHRDGKFFYITDVKDAYPSVDLERLAALVVYVRRYHEYKLDFSLRALGQNPALAGELREDRLFPSVLAFLESFCSGPRGEGLAVGGPLSPYLFNLYCEVFSDQNLRRVCAKYGITFTRYADDNVFSRQKPIIGDIRRELRRCIDRAGFEVNHRKSRVLSREMGVVHVTKIGLRGDPSVPGKTILVFPKKKGDVSTV